MRTIVWITFLLWASAEGDQKPMDQRSGLPEMLAKAFQVQLPPSTDLTFISNERDNSIVDFAIGFTFNILATKFPPAALIQNIIQLVRCQFHQHFTSRV